MRVDIQEVVKTFFKFSVLLSDAIKQNKSGVQLRQLISALCDFFLLSSLIQTLLRKAQLIPGHFRAEK
jgi:hypothetical protein